MSELIGAINPLAPEAKVADRTVVRQFVKNLNEVADKIKDAKSELREVIISNEEIQSIDEKIKELREERKNLIATNSVIQSYIEIVDEAIEEKRQLISDAKQDGIPRGEIDLAIRALKKDLDMKVSTEVYTNIADLVE
jgi:vacuolar-type H+-ATPase subunit I/STV1